LVKVQVNERTRTVLIPFANQQTPDASNFNTG
jgi:hypothetical protein